MLSWKANKVKVSLEFKDGRIMFEKDDYVVNSQNGICKIDDIITMDMGAGMKA